MKRTILGMAEAGEPLLQQALEAIRAHQKVVDENDLLMRWIGYAWRLTTCTQPSATTSCTRLAVWVRHSTDLHQSFESNPPLQHSVTKAWSPASAGSWCWAYINLGIA